jgi:hypothetical protein
MKGQDENNTSLETKSDSLFGAAYAGVEQWAKLWWYSGVLTGKSMSRTVSGTWCAAVHPTPGKYQRWEYDYTSSQLS